MKLKFIFLFGIVGPRGDGWPGVSMYRQRPPGAGVYSTRFQGPHHMVG